MDYVKHFKKCEKTGVDTCPICGEELDMQSSDYLKRVEGEAVVFSATCCRYDWNVICKCVNGNYVFVSMA